MIEALPAAAFQGGVRSAAVGEAVRLLNKRIRRSLRRCGTHEIEGIIRVCGPWADRVASLSPGEIDAVLAEFSRMGWVAEYADRSATVIVRLPGGK